MKEIREKLIEDAIKYYYNNITDNDTEAVIAYIVDTCIEQLQPQDKWISVDLNMPPEHGTRILVARRKTGIVGIISWVQGDEEEYSHWMPLPAPPLQSEEQMRFNPLEISFFFAPVFGLSLGVGVVKHKADIMIILPFIMLNIIWWRKDGLYKEN